MNDWHDVNADLVITDPPFGINFDGKNGNYARDTGQVVEGYVEWEKKEYEEKIKELLKVIDRNLKKNGQILVFSGWNNSNTIHNTIQDFKGLTLRGKMYWSYNFAPYCKKRPSHNVYEIFWATKGDEWHYNNKCNYEHCQEREPNLSTLIVKRDYKKKMPKYPTRLPLKLLLILLDHFSREENLIFDPLAGSGMVGIASEIKKREWKVGDLNKEGKKVFKELIKTYQREGYEFEKKSAQQARLENH